MANLKRFVAACGVFAVTTAVLGEMPVTAGYTGSLEVKFNSFKNTNGQVCLTLFGGPKGFPTGGKGSNLKLARCVAVAKGGSDVTFSNLPYGNYAIAAIHDINSDGQLNKMHLVCHRRDLGFQIIPRSAMDLLVLQILNFSCQEPKRWYRFKCGIYRV
ncbi:MAG: DUF2141 domain-containing protein [Acaryochloridaceae cyanobacterium RU_4_10]|nr:DUF2141 domain-containing protein [Acaryochloridaceae cyanobacterium RU_4_10]